MGNVSEDEMKAMNDRMAAVSDTKKITFIGISHEKFSFQMRSKMLSSMDTVLESTNDPGMVDKALKASATVTANSDQMPLDNQVRSYFSFFTQE
jgi:hypothetical protein